AQPEQAVIADLLDIDHVTRIDDLTNLADGFAAALGPLHAFQRKDPDRALLADTATGFTAGLETDAGRLVADLQHHREPPRRDVGKRMQLGKFDAPIPTNFDGRHRPAPALRLVVVDEAVDQRLARDRLQLG